MEIEPNSHQEISSITFSKLTPSERRQLKVQSNVNNLIKEIIQG